MTRKRPTTAQKLAALKEGTEVPVDPNVLAYVEDPAPDERACLILARAYSGDAVVVSWANQVKACEFFNTNGLARTLDEIRAIAPHLL